MPFTLTVLLSLVLLPILLVVGFLAFVLSRNGIEHTEFPNPDSK